MWKWIVILAASLLVLPAMITLAHKAESWSFTETYCIVGIVVSSILITVSVVTFMEGVRRKL
jgi:uncharacterized membrane protein YsdA (DUF1294 family)